MFFSYVYVAEWSPFGEELLIRITVCFLCITSILILVVSNLCFEGRTVVLIAPVIAYLLLFTRKHCSLVLRKPVFGVYDQVPHKPG